MSFKNKTISVFIAFILAVVGFCVTPTLALADLNPDGSPLHDKSSVDNGDGTHKIKLTVTGDSDESMSEAGKVNVLIIYDESSSMTSNNVTTNPNRNRADYAEDVVHDFIESLRGYQNASDPSNIQVAVVGFGPTVGNNNVTQTWTSNLTNNNNGVNRYFDDGVDGTITSSHNYSRNNGTNWEAALSQAQTYYSKAKAAIAKLEAANK